MNWFWIVGIIANVTLTALAIVWVLRQGKPRRDDSPAVDESAPQSRQDSSEAP
jgi:hypothetical protein